MALAQTLGASGGQIFSNAQPPAGARLSEPVRNQPLIVEVGTQQAASGAAHRESNGATASLGRGSRHYCIAVISSRTDNGARWLAPASGQGTQAFKVLRLLR